MPIESDEVPRLKDIELTGLTRLLARYGLELQLCPSAKPIPGSYWGESEAGLRRSRLFARRDSPLHSILHEACHYICVDPVRRDRLDRDAGSDDAEETAVCYLQVLLADYLPGYGRERMFADMDRWGYSFRLGSAQAWFEQDAEDARDWLTRHRLISANIPSFTLRRA